MDDHRSAESYPPLIHDALRYLDSIGPPLSARDKRPWSRRLLWSMGLALPPPPFTGFWVNAVVSGGGFALYWSCFMAVSHAIFGGGGQLSLLISSALAGVFYGLYRAVRASSVAIAAELPTWRCFRTNLQSFVPRSRVNPGQ